MKPTSRSTSVRWSRRGSRSPRSSPVLVSIAEQVSGTAWSCRRCSSRSGNALPAGSWRSTASRIRADPKFWRHPSGKSCLVRPVWGGADRLRCPSVGSAARPSRGSSPLFFTRSHWPFLRPRASPMPEPQRTRRAIMSMHMAQRVQSQLIGVAVRDHSRAWSSPTRAVPDRCRGTCPRGRSPGDMEDSDWSDTPLCHKSLRLDRRNGTRTAATRRSRPEAATRSVINLTTVL